MSSACFQFQFVIFLIVLEIATNLVELNFFPQNHYKTIGLLKISGEIEWIPLNLSDIRREILWRFLTKIPPKSC